MAIQLITYNWLNKYEKLFSTLDHMPMEYHPQIRLMSCDIAERALPFYEEEYKDGVASELIDISRKYALNGASKSDYMAAYHRKMFDGMSGAVYKDSSYKAGEAAKFTCWYVDNRPCSNLIAEDVACAYAAKSGDIANKVSPQFTGKAKEAYLKEREAHLIILSQYFPQWIFQYENALISAQERQPLIA